MAPDQTEFSAALEHRLTLGLAALARTVDDVGAQCVSVFLVEMEGAIRLVYHWPEGSGIAPAPFRATQEVFVKLRDLQQPLIAECALTQFFNTAVTPASHSFLLLPWPERSFQVIIAFGFATRPPAACGIPDTASSTLHLAALATGIVSEIRRLRRDLHVVNERLGRRKTVERAKGLLQKKHGWSEQQAYEHLRRLSRQRRRTMADTADDILRAAHRSCIEPQP